MPASAAVPLLPVETTMQLAARAVGVPGGETTVSHRELEKMRRDIAKKCFEELKLLVRPFTGRADNNKILARAVETVRELKAALAAEALSPPAGGAGGLSPLEYRGAFQASSQCMVLCGLDGRFWEVNNAFHSFFGHGDSGECTLTSIVAQEESVQLAEQMELIVMAARSSGQPAPLAGTLCLNRRGDGTFVSCSVSLQVVLHRRRPHCFLVCLSPNPVEEPSFLLDAPVEDGMEVAGFGAVGGEGLGPLDVWAVEDSGILTSIVDTFGSVFQVGDDVDEMT